MFKKIKDWYQDSSLGRKKISNLEKLYYSMEINESPYWVAYFKKSVDSAHDGKEKYCEVSERLGAININCPWWVIAMIHMMEGGFSFSRGIHNGQSWNRVTTIAPIGVGPFLSWENSAVNAIWMMRNKIPSKWDVHNTLDFFERYNGLGYRKYHKDINTPYLWSGTKHYSKGKYVADGRFSSEAVSKQIGIALVLYGIPDFKNHLIALCGGSNE